MKIKQLLWCLLALLLASPPSVGVARVEAAQHTGHVNSSQASRSGAHGPLPDAVRRVIERFRDVNDAVAAGYVQNGGCVSGPNEGAMGVHYANFALFDDVVEVESPEVLVYEPRNGRLHLVAAEYVTPAAAWDGSHPSNTPQLMGHLFHFTPGPNRYGPDAFYELHVWTGKNNPHGTFADWNPRVSCDKWDGSLFP